jgi:hypothetical protein
VKKFIVLFVLVSVLLSGCYWNTEIDEAEVGLIMSDGVKVDRVAYAGRYTDMSSRWAKIEEIKTSNISAMWEDPDLVTKDKQPIGFKVELSFARARDSESVLTMWQKYRSEATDDNALTALVLARIPSIAKAITTKYSLDEMLGIGGDIDRQQVETELYDMLAESLKEVGIELRSATIANIAPAQSYMDLLQSKANAAIEVEVAQERTKMLTEQLAQEEAQTDIDLEVARRENLVAEERAKVYEESDRVYELRRLELLGNVLGESDKVYFVPEGADITLYIGAQPIQK